MLVSWALPKGLPVDPGSNHLAVHTEDHPLDYGNFAGDIPKGEYGGGHVDIWDHGTYELEKWSDREVMVVLHGEQAEGRYVLFPTRRQELDDPPHGSCARGLRTDARLVKPMLALAGELPNSDKGWAYEFKWDGVRAIVYVEGGRVRASPATTRTSSSPFPSFARSVSSSAHVRRPRRRDRRLRRRGPPELRPPPTAPPSRLVVPGRAPRPGTCRRASSPSISSTSTAIRVSSLPYDDRRKLLETLKLSGDTSPPRRRFATAKATDVLAISKERGLEGVVDQAPRLALLSRSAKWRLDQGQELPHPRGGDRRLDRGQGRARRQLGGAPSRHPER